MPAGSCLICCIAPFLRSLAATHLWDAFVRPCAEASGAARCRRRRKLGGRCTASFRQWSRMSARSSSRWQRWASGQTCLESMRCVLDTDISCGQNSSLHVPVLSSCRSPLAWCAAQRSQLPGRRAGKKARGRPSSCCLCQSPAAGQPQGQRCHQCCPSTCSEPCCWLATLQQPCSRVRLVAAWAGSQQQRWQ